MLARLRKAQEENEGGFTLIELLVVMIIIGILAAIAIPVFLSQRAKAQDSSAKADVSTIGKEIATYFVDASTAPSNVALVGTQYQVNGKDIGKQSENTTITNQKVYASDNWCVAVTNSKGDQKVFKYSAKGGLAKDDCVAGTDYTAPAP